LIEMFVQICLISIIRNKESYFVPCWLSLFLLNLNWLDN
jgi:hypothetical protein